jgi:hypothetical protein
VEEDDPQPSEETLAEMRRTAVEEASKYNINLLDARRIQGAFYYGIGIYGICIIIMSINRCTYEDHASVEFMGIEFTNHRRLDRKTERTSTKESRGVGKREKGNLEEVTSIFPNSIYLLMLYFFITENLRPN